MSLGRKKVDLVVIGDGAPGIAYAAGFRKRFKRGRIVVITPSGYPGIVASLVPRGANYHLFTRSFISDIILAELVKCSLEDVVISDSIVEGCGRILEPGTLVISPIGTGDGKVMYIGNPDEKIPADACISDMAVSLHLLDMLGPRTCDCATHPLSPESGHRLLSFLENLCGDCEGAYVSAVPRRIWDPGVRGERVIYLHPLAEVGGVKIVNEGFWIRNAYYMGLSGTRGSLVPVDGSAGAGVGWVKAGWEEGAERFVKLRVFYDDPMVGEGKKLWVRVGASDEGLVRVIEVVGPSWVTRMSGLMAAVIGMSVEKAAGLTGVWAPGVGWFWGIIGRALLSLYEKTFL